MLTRKQRQDALDKLHQDKELEIMGSPAEPFYKCPVCSAGYIGFDSYQSCIRRHNRNFEKEIAKATEQTNIDLLDRAIDLAKSQHISLSEAKDEIDRFLNPPTCKVQIELGEKVWTCNLPATHQGKHLTTRGQTFSMIISQ